MTNKNFVKFISTILSFALVFNVLRFNAFTAATSWSDSDGGTLYLEYTVTMSVISNVIFTKVIL